MADHLRAVVIGAAWAGEGHTRALQWCDIEVAAICARQPEVVRQVADRLGVAEASTDWRRTLDAVRPDIVALATPTLLRGEVVEAAAGLGSHILCDKPLAAGGEEAGRLYRLADAAGIKHAYAATHRYDPSVAWLAELVRNGAIGPLHEIVWTLRLPPTPLAPWSWASTVAGGGGLLNNGLTHALGMLERILEAEVAQAAGESRVLQQRAPVVPDLHDYRLRWTLQLTPEEATRLEWRACDADDAFTALLRFATASGPVHATLIAGTGIAVAEEANGIRLQGEQGVLVASGFLSFAVARVAATGVAPELLPVPPRLLDQLPQVGDDTQNKWCALARDFVADIRGEAHAAYLTFRDGWRYQVAIDAIRSGSGWRQLPA